MPAGLVGSSFSPQALAKLRHFEFVLPIAANTTYLSAATKGGSGAAFSIASATAGTAIPLSSRVTDSGTTTKPLCPYARLPTLTLVDNSGSNLSCTVQLIGRRFGRRVVQSKSVDSSGGGTTTVAFDQVLDEVISATITAIANNTTSDTIAIGIDDSRLGLPYPIRTRKAVKRLFKISSGTPDTTGGIATATLQSATNPIVYTTDSSIDVKQAYSSTAIAVTDRYLVDVVPDGVDEFVQQAGMLG